MKVRAIFTIIIVSLRLPGPTVVAGFNMQRRKKVNAKYHTIRERLDSTVNDVHMKIFSDSKRKKILSQLSTSPEVT